MIYLDIIPLMQKGSKFKRPYMGKAYLAIENNTLFLYVDGNKLDRFSMSNEDLMALDWMECERIEVVSMKPANFVVECPKCSQIYSVGNNWETRTGDSVTCVCGTTLLLSPPEWAVCLTTASSGTSKPCEDVNIWPKAT